MTQSPKIEARIIAAAEYLETHSEETISLEDLADQVAISPFHLQRKFSGLFGMSPKQFQNALRIQNLKQQLKTGRDVTDAIYQSGFGSTSRLYEQIDQQLGMTPTDYQKGGENLEIHFAISQCQFGKILMAATERGVCFLHFAKSAKDLILALHKEFPAASLYGTPENMDAELDKWMRALDGYFKGKFALPSIPLDLHGTAFQLSVWRFLSSIKEGQTASYQEVATGIGSPKSYRAVANACGANNVALLIPCHRVLRGDGSIGGYRWGSELKESLLQSEAKKHG